MTKRFVRRLISTAFTAACMSTAAGVCAAPLNASRTLLDALSQPASGATAAAALFTWRDGPAYDLGGSGAGAVGSASAVATAYQGTPTGPLADALARLARAESAATAALSERAGQSMAALPPEMRHLAGDPQAQAALQEKMAAMTEQQKIAYAMRMQQQMMQAQTQRIQAMAQSAGEPTEAENTAMNKLQDALTSGGERRAQALIRYDQTLAALQNLNQQWAQGHDAIEASAVKEVGAIPYEKAYESGGGCYGTAAARKVRQIGLEYADRQVSQANRDLAQARQWAAGVREQLLPLAQEDDVMMAYYASIHNAMLRQQIGGAVQTFHRATFGQYFQPYADGVRDADLEAARWVHARNLLKKQPLETCS